MPTLFIDENKSSRYLLVAARVDDARLATARRQVALLRKPGQRRVHFVKESDSRRRYILSAMVDLELTATLYYAPCVNELRARQQCLEAVVRDALPGGRLKIVLERDESIEKFDRHVLFAAAAAAGVRGDQRLSYAHERAADEPMLWVPDAIAWCQARGGDWKRRSRSLVALEVNASR